MDDFRSPNSQYEFVNNGPAGTFMNHAAQEHVVQYMGRKPKTWPFGGASLKRLFNLNRTPIERSLPTPKLGVSGAEGGPGTGAFMSVQLSAVGNLVPHEYLAPRRIPRLWNPALRCAPNAFGNASNGVNYDDNVGMLVYLPEPEKKESVLMKIKLWRPAPIRAMAGQANARPAAGGSGSVENVRIPSISTLAAF